MGAPLRAGPTRTPRAIDESAAFARRGRVRAEARLLAADLLPVGVGLLRVAWLVLVPGGTGVGDQVGVEEEEAAVRDLEGLAVDLDFLALGHGGGAPSAVGGFVLAGVGLEAVEIGLGGEAVGDAAVFEIEGFQAGSGLAAPLGEVGDGVVALDGQAGLVEVVVLEVAGAGGVEAVFGG